jgi:hypothetical protein
MKKLIFTVFSIAILSSCVKKRCCYVPLEYQFAIINAEGVTYFNQKPIIRVFTINGDERVYLEQTNTFEYPESSNAYKYVYHWYIPYMSGDTFKKTYYLELPEGDVDTLYLDVRSNEKSGSIIYEEKFNGKSIDIDDQSLQYVRIHLLKK